jgi:hypothetical protein
VLSSSEKIEKLRQLVNQRLSSGYEKVKRKLKESPEYKARINEDVRKMMVRIVVDSLKQSGDFQALEKKFSSTKEELETVVDVQKGLFLKEFLDLMKRSRDKVNVVTNKTVPPSDNATWHHTTSEKFTESDRTTTSTSQSTSLLDYMKMLTEPPVIVEAVANLGFFVGVAARNVADDVMSFFF